LVVPRDWRSAAERLAQNLFLAAPTLAQYVALAALRSELRPVFEQRRRCFARRREVLLEALPTLGFELGRAPRGAFYIFAGVPRGQGDTALFTRELLEQEAVALTPGIDFGEQSCDTLVRLSYTEDEPRLREAMMRLRRFLSAPTRRRL
jgi:aspartate/methionine/tyrosine aminotransferase